MYLVIYLFIHLFIYLFIYLSLYLFIYWFNYLFIYLFICLFYLTSMFRIARNEFISTNKYITRSPKDYKCLWWTHEKVSIESLAFYLKATYAPHCVERCSLRAIGISVILLSQDSFESKCPETKFQTITF